MPNSLTPEQSQERKRLFLNGATIAQIAAIQGCSVQAVHGWLVRQGLKTPGKSRRRTAPET